MRISLLCSVASLFLASTAAFAQGEGEFPATLAGHAVLPALSFIEAPADAPDDLKTSGKYTTGRRVDAIGSVMGKSYERPTGVSLPFKADRNGKILAVFETVADGKPVRSPDHWAVQSPGAPGATYTNVNLRRSKGFEGFASSKDGKFIYGLLEGPLWDVEKKDWERVDGKEASRILEFDVAAEKFTGRYWQYVFDQNGNAIGDFNMIDATNGLIIERDNGEGTADKACPQGTRGENCFPDIAKFKRVYKVELNDANVGKPVRKVAYIDLMKIRDPDNKARKPLNDGVLTFPFFTIENVDRIDETHIIVGNDNNLPFSSSRDPNKADDNEFVLLEVGDFLKAK